MRRVQRDWLLLTLGSIGVLSSIGVSSALAADAADPAVAGRAQPIKIAVFARWLGERSPHADQAPGPGDAGLIFQAELAGASGASLFRSERAIFSRTKCMCSRNT